MKTLGGGGGHSRLFDTRILVLEVDKKPRNKKNCQTQSIKAFQKLFFGSDRQFKSLCFDNQELSSFQSLPMMDSANPRMSSILNVSVNSKPDHPPPGDPRGIHTPGVGFSPSFLFPGARGFELEKFSTVLKEKCRNSSNCLKETGGSLKSRCSCAVSYRYQFLQKQ